MNIHEQILDLIGAGSTHKQAAAEVGVSRQLVTTIAAKARAAGDQRVPKMVGRILHGMSGDPAYSIWCMIHERCRNPKVESYEFYGGRGIRVCERWSNFANFISDMGKKPEGRTIERDNVNGNYEPGNCRWATKQEQYFNRRDSLLLTAFGETKCAAEWLLDSRCAANGSTLYIRIERGWNHERAITQPMQPQKNRSRGPGQSKPRAPSEIQRRVVA